MRSEDTDLSRVDSEDGDSCFRPRRRELDLAIYAAGSEESGVEDVDAVSSHDDLDIFRGFEAV
jgi:hypothetical protein